MKNLARITAYRDGPLIVRGEVELVDSSGAPIDPGRKPFALCRCGKSRQLPFCDGTHKVAGFRAPLPAQPAAPAES